MSGVRKRLVVFFAAIVFWLAASAVFPRIRAIRADGKLPVLTLKDTHLANGLRVILAPDHSAPVYAINVSYNVGSRNERPGRTGFAHLVRAHDVPGLANVGKGEHFHPGAEQWRRDERHHERGPHHLFRGVAEESARSGHVSRSRPHALAQRHPERISTISESRARKNAARASIISPTAAPSGYRQPVLR